MVRKMIRVKKCDNIYCSFWEKDRCLLEGITVDEYGHCQEYVYPDIPEELFEQKRKEMREKILAKD
ncbi:MAG: hypothetical protein HFE39_10510 [Clostridiales bacterium]|nr:hypothetical protein [Clostridiales bacterium]